MRPQRPTILLIFPQKRQKHNISSFYPLPILTVYSTNPTDVNPSNPRTISFIILNGIKTLRNSQRLTPRLSLLSLKSEYSPWEKNGFHRPQDLHRTPTELRRENPFILLQPPQDLPRIHAEAQCHSRLHDQPQDQQPEPPSGCHRRWTCWRSRRRDSR